MMLDLCLPGSWVNEEAAIALVDSISGSPAARPAVIAVLGTTLVKTNGVFYGVPGFVKTNVALRPQNGKTLH